MHTLTDTAKLHVTRRGSAPAPRHGHTAHLSQKLMAERETVGSWMSWPSTSCNKAPQERPSQWGEEVSEQQPVVACTFSYWLSLYSEPLCGCQIPSSTLCAERGPLPCLLISIFPPCLKLLSLLQTHQPQRKWASASVRDVLKMESLRVAPSLRCQGSFWIVER